jgi:hypothetical protein
MRFGLLVIALAACSPRAAAGPAWPKATVREVDGGESLGPRAAARAIAASVAIEKADKPADPEAADEPAAVVGSTGSSTADKPAGTALAAPTPDDPIMIEEIVIEIEDD